MQSPPQLNLIVHADDFGISESVNQGIVEANLGGILTSASIMANGGAFEHAVQLAQMHPSLDVGIHLTLVEEKPILAPETIPSLCAGTGCFHAHAINFTERYFQGRIDLDDVRKELDAQISKVLATGLSISHLDSHQHLHMLPGILKITLELARKYGIARLRFPNEAIRGYMLRKPGGLGRVAQLAVLNAFCALGKNKIPNRPDHFVGFYHGGALNLPNLLEIISHLPASGVCELMCHPGHDDPSSARAHWGYRWPDELAALVDLDVAAALRARSVKLISYRDMPE
jgi:chitin disaccharide deacetylase